MWPARAGPSDTERQGPSPRPVRAPCALERGPYRGGDCEASVLELVLVDAVGVVAPVASATLPVVVGCSAYLREAGRTDAVTLLEMLLADEPTTPVTAVDDLALLTDLTEARDTHATM